MEGSRDLRIMPQEPSSIGRYQIQRVLGQGAMGVVYLAMDPLLKRLVAIKVVHAAGDDAARTLARFQREAEISARLNHPNIVTVYDVGSDPNAGPFLTMEYVDGTSLSKLIRIGISVEAGMRLLVQGMGALQAAHAEGIVHRDIKPDNILVSQDGRFKLMDFGIARRNESHFTQAGMIFGTPSFTAPELLTGGAASPATDRYAYAVTAFEVVTGRLPFSGQSVGSTLYRIVHDAPTFPAGTKPYLEAVFRKALDKNPDARYPDLSSFMSSLVEALDFSEEVKIKMLAYITGDHPFPPTQPMLSQAPPSSVPFASQRTELLKTTPASAVTSLLPDTSEPMDPEFARFLRGEAAPGDVTEIHPVPPGSPQATQPTPVLPVITELEGGAEAPSPGRLRALLTSWRTPRGRWIWLGSAALLLAVAGGITVKVMKPAPPTLLLIRTTPEEAQVLVDDQPVGVAPVTISVAPETRPMVKVQLMGFVSQHQRFAPGMREMIFSLPKSPHMLDVTTDPEGADVYLEGKLMGRTPLKAMSVPVEGMPTLEIRKPGYETWSTQLDKDMLFPELITLTPGGRKKPR